MENRRYHLAQSAPGHDMTGTDCDLPEPGASEVLIRQGCHYI